MTKSEFIEKWLYDYGQNNNLKRDLTALIESEVARKKEPFQRPFKIAQGAHSDWVIDANRNPITQPGKLSTEEMEWLIARLNRE